MCGLPTAETGGLQEEAEQGRDTEQRSDGMTWLCGSAAALIPGINMYDPLVSLVMFQVAVEKYEEVLHHLEFAREMHKTLDSLTQNVS